MSPPTNSPPAGPHTRHPGYPAPDFVTLLRQRAKESPDREVYTFLRGGIQGTRQKVTYRDLDRRARAIGARLQAAGAAGERVILLFAPGYDYAAGFFGCLYAGAVAVPCYPPDPARPEASLERLLPILRDSGARFALTNAQVRLALALRFARNTELRKIEWITTNTPIARLSARLREWTPPQLGGEALAFLQYTSGSTGDPKGVMITHANLLHNLGWGQARIGVHSGSRAVIWLPPYHDLGLIGGLLSPVYTNYACTLFSPQDFLRDPLSWLEAVTEFKATVTGGPPFAYDLCARRATGERAQRVDLSSLEGAFIGAEPVSPDTLDRFAEAYAPRGFRKECFFPTYGLAENTLIVAGGPQGRTPPTLTVAAALLEKHVVEVASPDSPGARRLLGCGGLMPDQRTLVVDPESARPVAEGRIGEIWVSGPSVARGYWNRLETTETTFRARTLEGDGPFLRTGDLGFVHESELYLTGRLKDLIILNGRNHYPQDIEWTAQKAHPTLRPGGSIAFADLSEGSDRLIVVAELRKGAPTDTTALTATRVAVFQGVRVGPGLRASEVALIPAGGLPKTSSGKLQRKKTAELWRTGALPNLGPAAPRPAPAPPKPATQAPPLATGPASRALELIARESAFPAASLEPGQRLVDDLGFDSLMMANLFADREADFPGTKLPDPCTETTVGQLLRAVGGEGHEKTPRKAASAAPAAAPTEIPEKHFRIELFEEVKTLEQRFALFNDTAIANPYFKTREGAARATVQMDGREMIHFAGYNYLGLSGDPRVNAASKRAIDEYGTSASASRLASGDIPPHRALEDALATFLRAEAAVVMVAGHATNTTVIGHLVGKGDLIVHDSLAHDSIIQGSLLSGAARRPFPHGDWEALDKILTKLRGHYRRALVPIEGAYSMDGDIPDLPAFLEVKKRHRALLYVDEAHSIGVLGATGRGVTEHFGVDSREVDVLMGTLSKALASCGGYVAGSHALVHFLKYTAPAFVYSVGLPPSSTAASLEALRVLGEEPERLEQLRRNSALFLALAREAGLDTGPSAGTPILPVIVPGSARCLRLSDRLAARGINVQPILHPAVAENATRLRFFLSSLHTEEQIRRTVAAVAEELAKIP